MMRNGSSRRRIKDLIDPIPAERLEKLTADQVADLEQQRMLLNAQLVENVLSLRQEVFRATVDPRRDIYDECGFPKNPTASIYQDLYDRDGVACRVVEVLPKETWRVSPEVYELEESDEPTPFEAAWDALHRQLRGQRSWFKQEVGSPIWDYLSRLDVLSGIGRFGVLLLGLDDGKPLWEPVDGIEETGSLGQDTPQSKEAAPTQQPNSKRQIPVYNLAVDQARTRNRRLMFLRVFPESLVSITRFESNPSSPRFGLPVIYQITLHDQRENHTGVGLPMGTYNVHWTRVIHYADNLKSSEVYGVPRMQPVLNNLLSLQKLYGASPEGYWRNCVNKIFLSTHPQLGGDVDVNLDELRDVFENMENGQQKWAFLRGMSPMTVPASLVDPTPHKDMLIETICIAQGIPVPVFKGYEIGEQASDNNRKDWESRIKQRQFGVVTPRMVIQFIDRLIMLGVLPEPNARPKAKTQAIDPMPGEPVDDDHDDADETPLEPPSGKDDDNDESQPPTRNVITLDGMGLPPRTYGGVDGQYGGESFGFRGPAIVPGDKLPPVESDLGYCVDWPDISSASEKEKAEVLALKAQAYSAYTQGMASIVSELDFLTKFDVFSEEEAQAILSTAARIQEEQEGVAIEEQRQMIDQSPGKPPLGTGLPNSDGTPREKPPQVSANASPAETAMEWKARMRRLFEAKAAEDR